MSTVLAIILVITSLMGTTMIAQAANYSAFPVCQEEKEDALQTAPELKLNQSYRVSFKNGVYTNPERTELYNVYEPNKVLKFIPTSNGYYEASIYIADRNQHMTVQFAYSDAESIKDNKYYSVSNGSYEYNIIPQKRRPLRLPPIMCTEIRPVARHIFKRARPTILWPMQPMMITMWKRP